MIVQENPVRDFLRLFVWFPLRWFTPRAPLGVSLAIFRLMGKMLYFAAVKKQALVRSVMKETLRRLPGDYDLEKEVNHYFQQHIVNSLFPFTIRQLTPEYLDSVASVTGYEHIEEALRRGKGCILIQGHVGPVQFPLVYLNHRGLNVGQVYYRHVQGLSRIGRSIQLRYREEIERDLKAEMFAVNSYQRPLYRWLKANNVLLMSGDGIGGLDFIGYYSQCPFLGRSMLFPMGPYRLSTCLDAPLIPIHVSLEGTHYSLRILPPLKTDCEGDEAIADLAGQFIRLLEYQIIQKPHSWHFWDGFRKGLLIPQNGDLPADHPETDAE